MLINSFSTSGITYNKTGNTIRQDKGASFDSNLASQQPTEEKSAEPATITSPSPQTQSIINNFHEWKQEYYQGGVYADRIAEVENASADFEKIISKAVEQNGYDDPKSFVQSLSSTELAALQAVHSLADPIQPNGLSKEGALNLLYSPNDLHDIDNDGFEMIGLGKMSVFPPPNAPESVKKAWKETTSHLNGSDKMLLSGIFLALPSELGGKAYIPPDADYKDIIQKRIDGVEFSKKVAPQSQHEISDRLIAMLNDFKFNLG